MCTSSICVARIICAGIIIIAGARRIFATIDIVTIVNSTCVRIITNNLSIYTITSNTGTFSAGIDFWANNGCINTLRKEGRTRISSTRIIISADVRGITTSRIYITRIIRAPITIRAVNGSILTSEDIITSVIGTSVAIITISYGIHAANVGKTIIRCASITIRTVYRRILTSEDRITG